MREARADEHGQCDAASSSWKMDVVSFVDESIVAHTNVEHAFFSNQAERSAQEVNCKEAYTSSATNGVQSGDLGEPGLS